MVPASALYRGENLDRRVRRLVATDAPPGSSPANRWPLHLAGAALAVLGLTALEQIHAVVEVLIHALP